MWYVLARSVWSTHQHVPDFLGYLLPVFEKMLRVKLGKDCLEDFVANRRQNFIGVVSVQFQVDLRNELFFWTDEFTGKRF